MNYTLHQLRIFLEVVRHESITKAAHSMHMTQPALSIQQKNFQMQFDVPLTEIIGKKLYVTDFGREIAEIAERIISEADVIKYKTKEYSGMYVGKLRITAVSTGKYVIPYFLTGFIKNYPGIDLVLDVSNKESVLKSLENNEIDFAFVSVIPDNLLVNEEILLENKLYLTGDTPVVDRNKPLIFREEGSATRKIMDNHFSTGMKRKSMQLTSNEAVKQAIIAGLGYSVLPLIGIKNELINQQLHIIPEKGLPISTNWRLIWLKRKKLSPVAKAYLDYIQDKKEELIENNFKWFLDFEEK